MILICILGGKTFDKGNQAAILDHGLGTLVFVSVLHRKNPSRNRFYLIILM